MSRSHVHVRAVLFGALFGLASSVASVCCAQPATVTPSGLRTQVNGSASAGVAPGDGVYRITGGTRNGSNLFHSFGDFGPQLGEIATFLNIDGNGVAGPSAATTNILARVTGGNPSNIFGTVSTIDFAGGAHLFLMNPAGILFGPSAQLNLSGSFHATTANYLKLGGDGTFYANDASGTNVLTASPPSAFGFLTSNPASIDVLRGGFDFDTEKFKSLAVPEGRTLSLVGGALNLGAAELRDGGGNIVQSARPAWLHAPGGRVNLVSVASAGEAAFDGTGFNVGGFAKLGDVNINGGTLQLDFGDGPFEILSASFIDGKEVFIRGGKLAMSNAVVSPGALSSYTPSPDGGEVNIDVTGAATITGTGLDQILNTYPGIYTRAGAFIFFAPETFDPVKVPDITIKAGSLTLSGNASIKTERYGPGTAAKVAVDADVVAVRDAASIVSLNYYDGPGGNIEINAREVDLSGDGSPSPTGVTGVAAQNLIHPCFSLCPRVDARLTSADAGSITVNAKESLKVSGNALIVTDSLGFGRGGDIKVEAGDITVTGNGADTAAIKAQTALAGNAGNVAIHATGTINLESGGQIAGTTIGSGTGSSLVVKADKSMTFSGADSRIVNATGPAPVDQLNQIFNLQFFSSFEDIRDDMGLPADATVFDVLGAYLNDLGFTPMPALTPGNAGTTTIATPLLTLNAGTRIEMSTGWEGNAGALTASVGSLFVNDGARISSLSGIERLTGEAVVGTGNAGSINITATDTISISGRSPTTGAGSSISTTTFGNGAAGDISLSANQVNVQNGGRVASESGGVLGGTVAVGTGSGGVVSISASDTITVSGQNSTVSTSTFGDGKGGDVTLNAGNKVAILDSGRVKADSGGPLGGSVVSGTGLAGNITITSGNEIYLNNGQITTQALTADGGNITLTAPNMVQLQDSGISTSVAGGAGQGGNITIDPQFVIVNSSSIIANAFGGPGGNITITADNFLQSASSVIEASSALSTPGTIAIQSPENNVESSIAQLPAAFVDASALLRGLCTARRTGAPSSFVVAGRGGVPVDPDGYQPSFGSDVAMGLASTDGAVLADAGRLGGQRFVFRLAAMQGWDCSR